MLFKRRKKYLMPKKVFEGPSKHRFTFVPEGTTYFGGFVVTVSENVSTKKEAFFYASVMFLRSMKTKTNNVSVFYGDAESPDCMDVLYRSYSSFDKVRKKVNL